MRNAKRSTLAAMLAATACALSLQALAEVRVLQLYSSPDGEYQAILLEDDVLDSVDRFRGLTLVMHDVRGASRSVTLTPDRVLEDSLVVDGKRRFLVATRQALVLAAHAGRASGRVRRDRRRDACGVRRRSAALSSPRARQRDDVRIRRGRAGGVEFRARAACARVAGSARRCPRRTSSRTPRQRPSCASTTMPASTITSSP